MAARRGAEPGLPEHIDAVVDSLGYPLRRAFDPLAVTRALGSDKKRRHGRQRWILPMAVGHVTEADDITDAELDDALALIRSDVPPAARGRRAA
jgi:3-dehydroquinate synthetase